MGLLLLRGITKDEKNVDFLNVGEES